METTNMNGQPLSPIVGGEGDDRETLAQEIAEAPERIQRRLDLTQVLDGMRRGVLVDLRIMRPRFTVAIAGKKKTTTEMPGLEKLGLVLSEDGQRILSVARRCLAEHSIKTHWGAFVPSAAYKRWAEANERYKAQFLALKDRILDKYDAMRATVEADYRRLAEDAWMHATFGRVALQAHHGSTSSAMAADLTDKLAQQSAHDQFVEQYMVTIQAQIPTREQLEDAFEYDYDLSYIPLPSQLARERAMADVQVREQLLQEASAQAELETIAARSQAEIQMVQAETKMHEDVIKHAQEQRERLVSEFYADVVSYMNERISEVCHKTRESLKKNGKALRGPNAESLRDLVTMMEGLNIVGDQHIEEQIAKLREALPPRWSERAKGVERLDTSRLEVVVRELEADAEQVLLELDLTQAPRARRKQPLTIDESLIIADEPRRSARSKPSLLPVNLATSRRKKNKAASQPCTTQPSQAAVSGSVASEPERS
jgi:hypothetical protein